MGQLLEDSEQRTAAVEKADELDEELSRTVERLQEVENEGINKIADLQKQLQEKNREIDTLKVFVLLTPFGTNIPLRRRGFPGVLSHLVQLNSVI